MDAKQVHETINQLVEAQHDRTAAQTQLREFQNSNNPPLAPGEFDSLQSFLDFHDQRQAYEDEIRSLKVDRDKAQQRYDQARAALSKVLPANVLLNYAYEGDREELKGWQFEIMNASAAGRGQIRIAFKPPQP
jgi:DNA repair exonuclease SbcCD ATPase subunit